jgi:hypothetical protein
MIVSITEEDIEKIYAKNEKLRSNHRWVEVRDIGHDRWSKRILVSSNPGELFLAVHMAYIVGYFEGDEYEITAWKHIREIEEQVIKPMTFEEACRALHRLAKTSALPFVRLIGSTSYVPYWNAGISDPSLWEYSLCLKEWSKFEIKL